MVKIDFGAKIVAHSTSLQGDELISVSCVCDTVTAHKIALEHKDFSITMTDIEKVEFNELIEQVKENPFIPIAWQKDHKGMQVNEYHTEEDSEYSISTWLDARDRAIQQAILLNSYGTTKQICNRLLEPFMWTTMLITGSREGWDNFFKLRCPIYTGETYRGGKLIKSTNFKSWKDLCHAGYNSEKAGIIQRLECNKGQAEIHMMALAESIYDAINGSTPKQLKGEEWHIPLEDKINITDRFAWDNSKGELIEAKVKISTAMAAHTPYTVVGDEKEVDYQKMIELYDRLITQIHKNSDYFEHCARAMNDEEYNSFIKGKFDINYAIMVSDDHIIIDGTSNLNSFGNCNNLKGFVPYKYIIIIDNITF